MQDLQPRPGKGRRVQVGDLPRLTCIRIPLGVRRSLEHGDRKLVDKEMVRVWVPLVVVVAEHHLWPLGADDRHETFQDLIDVGVDESVRVRVRGRVGHPGVSISKHDDIGEPENGGAFKQFPSPDCPDVAARLLAVGSRVENVAGLSPGGCDQDRAHSGFAVARHRAPSLARLVIGMGMERQKCARHRAS